MDKWLNSIATSFRNTWTGYGQTQHTHNTFNQAQEQEALAAERRKIVALAEKFDQLASAGYESILGVLTEKVNSEIAEATRTPLEPETQRVHVIRWNAMRELLDAMVNHINDTMARRDEIQQEQRRMQVGG